MPPEPDLPNALRQVLEASFFIRFTTSGRRTGRSITVETTYVWDGGHRIYISGYPGARDWVANLGANPAVTVHTVEGTRWFDIPAEARVLRDRSERMPHLMDFLDRWAFRPESPRSIFGLAVRAMRLNSTLRLPWWGPFYLARRVLDRMPCVELTFTGGPVPRPGGPPPLTRPMDG